MHFWSATLRRLRPLVSIQLSQIFVQTIRQQHLALIALLPLHLYQTFSSLSPIFIFLFLQASFLHTLLLTLMPRLFKLTLFPFAVSNLWHHFFMFLLLGLRLLLCSFFTVSELLMKLFLPFTDQTLFQPLFKRTVWLLLCYVPSKSFLLLFP